MSITNETPHPAPVRRQASLATAYQQAGKIAGTSLTASHQTIITTTAIARVVHIINSCNAAVVVSLNGTTDYQELPASTGMAIDLVANSLHIASGATITAKHAGSAPTSGNIAVSVVG